MSVTALVIVNDEATTILVNYWLINKRWRHDMDTLSALLTHCEKNPLMIDGCLANGQ